MAVPFWGGVGEGMIFFHVKFQKGVKRVPKISPDETKSISEYRKDSARTGTICSLIIISQKNL